MTGSEDILNFWLDDVGQQGWYQASDVLDKSIRDKFEGTWNKAVEGSYTEWLTHPRGVLAYVILVDQFPRNMFRGAGKSFASDKIALAATKSAIHQKFDLRVKEPARQFFYTPLMHSESLCDQERCVRMMMERMPKTGPSNMLHAKAHREVIRKFGRFPYRNDALARNYTTPEKAYIEQGGYGVTVQALQAAV